jgi:hypothetical protein
MTISAHFAHSRVKEGIGMEPDAMIRYLQTSTLFDLLMLKKSNEGNPVIRLDEVILKAKASMTQEDVAWVEKQIAELK